MSERPRIPIACSLESDQRSGRIEWWRAVMAHALDDPESTATGARVRLPAALEVEVRRLVAAESECCAFFEFDVTVRAGEVVLAVGAPSEARDLVDALLSQA